MKILQITRDYISNGGIGRYVQDLTAELRHDHDDVAVICGQGSPGPDGGVHVVPGCDDFEHATAPHNRVVVLDLAANFEPDLVFLHAMDDYQLELQLRERYRVARFVHNHVYCPSGIDHDTGSGAPCTSTQGTACVAGYLARRCWYVRNPLTAAAFYRRASAARQSLRSAPLVFTASQYMRQRVIAQGAEPGRVVVAPYFAGIAAPRTDSPPVRPSRSLLFVGRIVPEKGLHLLIQALTALDDDVRLIVNGDGSARTAAVTLTRNLGLEQRVEFLGWTGREELSDCYCRAAVVVVPSVWPEPFGLVGIEAMACGVPVVGFRSGAIPEWLEDGVTGFLVDPGDVAALAQRLRQLLDDPSLRRRMGCASRSRITERLMPSHHLAAIREAVGGAAW
ncbi:MAG: glycosyltransferase family 4 protein [Chloroflexi bacterium]|nr:glycosyltransferase family 4 protein [Chloroflexota bacterium]